MDELFFQQYWWFLVSLLAAILVFLLFVQGGQSLLFRLGQTESERTLLVNALGRKWEFTFTTLVTFGGAFFASFPLYYSTSFGGAYWLWMAILFCFILQAVSYEFRSKSGNLFGKRTYEIFLFINGLGVILLGVVVGMMFSGGSFIINKSNLTEWTAGAISSWDNPLRGLEALANLNNLLLGGAVFCLARVLAVLYFIQNIDDDGIRRRSHKQLHYDSAVFVVLFLAFLVRILIGTGYEVNPETGIISAVDGKYFRNLVEMPVVAALLLVGVAAVLFGILRTLIRREWRSGIWFAGSGTIAAVLALLLTAGWNNTAYFPSTSDLQSSLTIQNSSSSFFTLKVMSYVSLMIPVVAWYIFKAWKAINNKPISSEEMEGPGHHY